MKKKFILIAAIIFLLACSEKPTENNVSHPSDILDKLSEIPTIEVNEIIPQNGFSRQFEINVIQPLDHFNDIGINFKQRIFISHNDLAKPVIFMPSGYSSSPIKLCELSVPLNANQVYATHRFMEGAEPSPLNWQYLNIEQASADFHNIVEIFKQIYSGPWISYGISKNGQSALFHKSFYPDDVNATIAIAAPLSFSTEDIRYEHFLSNCGTVVDRKKIYEFQINSLKHRKELIPLINNYLSDSEFHFNRMNAGKILEFEILEFPFSFWQVTDGDCSKIPDTSASSIELFNYIQNFGYINFYSDELMNYFQPVYYQAYSELGWYKLIDDHLLNYLCEIPNPSYRLMAPENTNIIYHPNVITNVVARLQSVGNNIIYIYGGNDPWSACAIESTGSTNSIKIVQPGANHNIKISDLEQKTFIYSKLEEWTNLNFK